MFAVSMTRTPPPGLGLSMVFGVVRQSGGTVASRALRARRSIGPSIAIHHVLATELWPVLIDVSQMETALLGITRMSEPNRGNWKSQGSLLVTQSSAPNLLADYVYLWKTTMVTASD
jgi:hypothetical protein